VKITIQNKCYSVFLSRFGAFLTSLFTFAQQLTSMTFCHLCTS